MCVTKWVMSRTLEPDTTERVLNVVTRTKHACNGLALCAGIGGLELGLSLALGDGFRVVCHVEWEAYAAPVLVARMADTAFPPYCAC